MKLFALLKTGEALKRLSEKRFTSYRITRAIFSLRKKVDDETKCYVEEEKKLVNLYAEKDQEGNDVIFPDGRIKLKDESSKQKFESEVNEIRNTEIEVETLSLRESDFRSPDDIPSPEDMFALDGLIDFTED